MTTQKENIAIIGGGLAGLVLALHLKRYGISATIYEKQAEDYIQGGPITLSPNASRALPPGLAERIIALGYAHRGLTLVNVHGVSLGWFSHGSEELNPYPALRILRARVRDEFLKECKTQAIKIIVDKSLVSLKESEDGVELNFADGSTVNADRVIGADGIRSVVRKYLLPDVEPYYNGFTVIYGTVKKEQLSPEELNLPISNMVFGLAGTFSIIPFEPSGEDISYLSGIAGLPDRSREEWAAWQQDKKGLYDELQRFSVDPWPKMVQAAAKKVKPEDVTTWPVHVVPNLPRWTSSSSRVIIIGDAAHAQSPAAAQGAGTSWEDAQTLAYALSTGKGDAVKKWEAQRIERVAKIVAYSAGIEAKRRPSPNAVLQWVKERVVMLLMWWHKKDGMAAWINGYDAEEAIKSVL